MRILLVKTSSLGDLIHTFPAISDAGQVYPGITVDWVVEEALTAIPSMHPGINRIIPVAMRRWRQSWWQAYRGGEWGDFVKVLRGRTYDAVIDAQGLLKSGLITRKARGITHGYAKDSAREPIASLFYKNGHHVARHLHAVERTRQLFARSLGYELNGLPVNYGLSVEPAMDISCHTVMFLHGTTWKSKQWPLAFWRTLAGILAAQGLQIIIPAAGEAERHFAEKIAQDSQGVNVLPPLALGEISQVIRACAGVVSVDTGLAHLAAALEVPGVALYGATSTEKTGTYSDSMIALQSSYACSPCYLRCCNKIKSTDRIAPCTEQLPADVVAQALLHRMQAAV